MSLAVVVAYEIYLEVVEVELNLTWKYENIVELWTFHDLLSNQISTGPQFIKPVSLEDDYYMRSSVPNLFDASLRASISPPTGRGGEPGGRWGGFSTLRR